MALRVVDFKADMYHYFYWYSGKIASTSSLNHRFWFTCTPTSINEQEASTLMSWTQLCMSWFKWAPPQNRNHPWNAFGAETERRRCLWRQMKRNNVMTNLWRCLGCKYNLKIPCSRRRTSPTRRLHRNKACRISDAGCCSEWMTHKR